jgi:hypothetical protein
VQHAVRLAVPVRQISNKLQVSEGIHTEGLSVDVLVRVGCSSFSSAGLDDWPWFDVPARFPVFKYWDIGLRFRPLKALIRSYGLTINSSGVYP